MAGSGIMPHEVDRHLVAGGIYLNRVDKELDKVPRDTVLPERREQMDELARQVKLVVALLEEVRTGRKRTRVPRTLAEVTDIDRYRKDFLQDEG